MRVLLGVGALAVLLAMPAAGAAPSGRIVFIREVGQQAELFSIRPDGSGLTRLTHEPAYDSAPVWSPDGRRIASFGTGGVVIRARDGSVLQRIAIPVEGGLESGPSFLGLVDLGSGRRARIPGTAGSADPSWSRAATIAFVRGRGVFVVRPDGRGLKRLARGSSPSRPTWSPGGRRLAYFSAERARDGNRWGVWVVRADGRGRRRVGAATDDRELLWPSDATRVLWEDAGQRLIVARSDRPRSAKLLTRGASPDWS
jgi:TolB protein